MALLLAAWQFCGCVGGGGGSNPPAASENGSATVTTAADGTTPEITAATESGSASATISAGTLLYDENGVPVTGDDLVMTITNYPSIDNLATNSALAASAFQTLYFAVSVKIKMGNLLVTQFKDKSGNVKPLTVNIKVKGLDPGQSFTLYLFNGTKWIEQGEFTVGNNHRAEISLTHLTLFGSGVFNSGTTGTGGTGTGSQGGTGKNF
jgi:hypothetical protein